MVNKYYQLLFSGIFFCLQTFCFSQNVGINIAAPAGKFHIKGSDDVSQLIIDADTIQGNTNPLVKFRKSNGTELLWLHSDDSTNVFLGLKAGKSNVTASQGIKNTFIGSRAGTSNSNGRDNTAIGTNAFFSNTKGSLNTAIGTSALYTQSYNPATWFQSYNVAIGFESLYANQPISTVTGINNTAVGTSSLRSNTIGVQNTANGAFTLSQSTNANSNTAIGYASMNMNTTSGENIAVGAKALFSQSFNNGGVSYVGGNVAIGYEALYTNQPFDNTYDILGTNNTAVGHSAMRSNTNGWNNTGIGFNALYANLSGDYNTATGFKALYTNTTGGNNTAIGSYALYFSSNGSYNTATGSFALYHNTTGASNSAFGGRALETNTSGNFNTATGTLALTQNSTGSDNTATGWSSQYATSIGNKNTSTGSNTLNSNISGNENTAFGYRALYVTTSSFNTALGSQAMYSNTNGFSNTAIGETSLYSNVSGARNTAAGKDAMPYLIGGSDNIAIGYAAGTASGSPNVSNTISIGNYGYWNGASNQAFIGNLSTGWNGGNVGWSTYSDARVKNHITEEVKGLDFITRLRPVTYYRSINAMIEITGNQETDDYPGKYDMEKIKFTGFLAQEVEQAAKEAHYDFSGITIPHHSNELYTLSYEQFVVPLVKAVQEQQVMIDALNETNKLLLARIEAIEKKLQ